MDEVVSSARKSIATYRPDSGDPDRQIQTMLTAIKSGANYVDIELDITENWIVNGALRMESYSDFGETVNYKIAISY